MDKQTIVPTHLGIILDGNRRWAKENGLSSFEGHKKGYQNFKDITKYAFDQGINFVTAFVFSTENWERTRDEVRFLMNLALIVLTKDLKVLHEENIKVVWLGTREKLSRRLLGAINNAEEETKNNTHGTLSLCFNYGGRQEIVDAVKKLINDGVKTEEISIQKINESLYAPEIPQVDLIIRTSGERRISDFMLFRSPYSELYFTDKHWPEFLPTDLDDALVDFAQRQRRYGK